MDEGGDTPVVWAGPDLALSSAPDASALLRACGVRDLNKPLTRP